MASRRQRRDFTEAFKAQAVWLVRESGKTVSAVARELDLTESALRQWVRDAGDRCDPRGQSGVGGCMPRCAPAGRTRAANARRG